MNYDFIFKRTLWGNVNLKVDYSYYKIEDYVASNWDYAKYNLWKNKNVPAGLEWSDMYINLDEVTRDGVEVELNGNILDSLYAYIGYAYQEFDYDGSQPAGMELGDVAKNRVNAGLRYNPFDKTMIMLDYRYQSKQVAHLIAEEPEGSGIWVSSDNPMKPQSVFDLGIEQTLHSGDTIKDVTLGLYVNNLLNEEYENARGYPMPDRTYHCSFSCAF